MALTLSGEGSIQEYLHKFHYKSSCGQSKAWFLSHYFKICIGKFDHKSSLLDETCSCELYHSDLREFVKALETGFDFISGLINEAPEDSVILRDVNNKTLVFGYSAENREKKCTLYWANRDFTTDDILFACTSDDICLMAEFSSKLLLSSIPSKLNVLDNLKYISKQIVQQCDSSETAFTVFETKSYSYGDDLVGADKTSLRFLLEDHGVILGLYAKLYFLSAKHIYMPGIDCHPSGKRYAKLDSIPTTFIIPEIPNDVNTDGPPANQSFQIPTTTDTSNQTSNVPTGNHCKTTLDSTVNTPATTGSLGKTGSDKRACNPLRPEVNGSLEKRSLENATNTKNQTKRGKKPKESKNTKVPAKSSKLHSSVANKPLTPSGSVPALASSRSEVGIEQNNSTLSSGSVLVPTTNQNSASSRYGIEMEQDNSSSASGSGLVPTTNQNSPSSRYGVGMEQDSSSASESGLVPTTNQNSASSRYEVRSEQDNSKSASGSGLVSTTNPNLASSDTRNFETTSDPVHGMTLSFNPDINGFEPILSTSDPLDYAQNSLGRELTASDLEMFGVTNSNLNTTSASDNDAAELLQAAKTSHDQKVQESGYSGLIEDTVVDVSNNLETLRNIKPVSNLENENQEKKMKYGHKALLSNTV